MFSSALKSLSSGITSNYSIAPQPSSTAGPWKIYDAKRKQTGKAASVFVFEKKSLESASSSFGGSRSGGVSLKRAHEEVIERLKREVSSLARLRHPSILELAEPVEETRNGGLMFATEPVTASLASLLREKDEQERPGGGRGRSSRYVVEEQDGIQRKKEVEIDELEIQKGILQLAKGLEFLHESAGLVHANLTPEAILINTKGDWKIAGLAFCGPHHSNTAATNLAPISLHEALNYDPRLPRIVQLDLDYTSPDFVLDNTLAASADMFSLGILIIALYNSPHASPLNTGSSLSSYKRLFSTASNIPTRSNNFLVPSARPLPSKMASDLLPRLITRRPAQRLNAKEFQEASYFDNILVSTIRFLESLPAKTMNEKSQFLRGLPKIMSQFPKSVLERKLLPTLLEEIKDPELLAPIITNVFAMLKATPAVKVAFASTVLPRLREIFVGQKLGERDSSKDAGLIVLLENIDVVAQNCAGKEFREDVLPILIVALESPTSSIVDVALSTLPHVLSVLDFSTIKNEVFPVVASVFSKTSSLNLKIRGLEAFYTLCGGTSDASSADGLSGLGFAEPKSASRSTTSILDKFSIQEKVVPLLKGIKTKEPGVMMAAHKVFGQISDIVDTDFLAMEILPILWSMSLGPLLDLQQFQSFMTLIKDMGIRIEREQTRKLSDLAGSSRTVSTGSGIRNGSGLGGVSSPLGNLSDGQEVDFETLVSGRKPVPNGNTDLMNDWATSTPAARPSNAPTFSWQTQSSPSTRPTPPTANSARSQHLGTNLSRTITPDQAMASFGVLQPLSTQYTQPLQPTSQSSVTGNTFSPSAMLPMRENKVSMNQATAIDWSAATTKSQQSVNVLGTGSFGGTSKPSAFNIPPPPMNKSVGNNAASSAFVQNTKSGTSQGQASGLDKYQSLI